MLIFDLILSYQVIKWLHILNFKIFQVEINFSAQFLFIFPAQASSRRRLGWILGKFLQRSILPKKNFFLSFTIEFVFIRISYITYVPLQISCRVPLTSNSLRQITFTLERRKGVGAFQMLALYVYMLQFFSILGRMVG